MISSPFVCESSLFLGSSRQKGSALGPPFFFRPCFSCFGMVERTAASRLLLFPFPAGRRPSSEAPRSEGELFLDPVKVPVAVTPPSDHRTSDSFTSPAFFFPSIFSTPPFFSSIEFQKIRFFRQMKSYFFFFFVRTDFDVWVSMPTLFRWRLFPLFPLFGRTRAPQFSFPVDISFFHGRHDFFSVEPCDELLPCAITFSLSPS